MPIENAIRNIINNHNCEHNEGHHYWHQKLSEVGNEYALEMINKIDHNKHHIGDFYRHNGMKIDLNRDSLESNNLLLVMNFIIDGLRADEANEDGNSILNKNLFSRQPKQENSQSLLIKYIDPNNEKDRKSRRFAAIDLLEEYEIKAIAVSILAETNGNSELAQFVLNNAGLKIIKSMNVGELNHLKSDLKSISATDNNSFNDHNF